MKKKVMIFLILFFIIIIALLFGKMTGKVISSFESCKDNDNGLNYFIKGEINGISYSPLNFYKGDKYQYEDYCSSNKVLVEYYCVSDNSDVSTRKASISYTCKNGCVDGRCVDEPGEENLEEDQKYIGYINKFV